MSRRFDELAARHGNLRARCAVQRHHLAQTAHDIEHRLSGIDRGINFVRHAAHSPALIASGVALVVLLRPKRLLRWASRGLLFYTTARRFRRLTQR